MSLADIIILTLIGIAFIAVCVRTVRKGSCADCAQGGVCSGNCSSAKKGQCAAVQGVDAVAEKLSRGVK